MFNFLKREKTKLRVKESSLPMPTSVVLGSGIDASKLPSGHMCCWKCHGFLFECSIFGDNHRVEMGCIKCNEAYRLLFPLTVTMPQKQGRFYCAKHPDKAMVLIHANHTICIGCESCNSEIRFLLEEEGLIVPT